MKSLAEMGQEVYDWALTKGWEPDEKRTFGDICALLHSEISEALEAFRDYGDTAGHVNGWREHIMDADYGDHKPLGVPSEFADLLIRLVHYAHVLQIDLEREYEAKMAYNQQRPYRHGGKAL